MAARDLDFIIRADENEDVYSLSRKVVYALTIQRLKRKKPSIWFIWGDSGEGKSCATLSLIDFILECMKLDLVNFVKESNVFTPIEYPEKMDAILNSRELRKLHVIAMHEAREVIPAAMWSKFVVRAVGDINAMSRSIKRLCIIIVSQFIKDIVNKIRYTLNYYCEAYRPLSGKARLYISVLWKDDRDLERPRLRKRPLRGKIIYPNKRYKLWRPSYLELPLPRREILKQFNELDVHAKRKLLARKITDMINELKKLCGAEENDRIEKLVDYFIQNGAMLGTIGKRTKRGFSVKSDITKMLDLTKDEKKLFVSRLKDRLKETGALEEESSMVDDVDDEGEEDVE